MFSASLQLQYNFRAQDPRKAYTQRFVLQQRKVVKGLAYI